MSRATSPALKRTPSNSTLCWPSSTTCGEAPAAPCTSMIDRSDPAQGSATSTEANHRDPQPTACLGALAIPTSVGRGFADDVLTHEHVHEVLGLALELLSVDLELILQRK